MVMGKFPFADSPDPPSPVEIQRSRFLGSLVRQISIAGAKSRDLVPPMESYATVRSISDISYWYRLLPGP